GPCPAGASAPAGPGRAHQRPGPGRHPRHPRPALRPPRTAGCTIFFASHYLDEVEKTATHLAVLHEGTIRLQASAGELERQLAGVLALDVDDAERGSRTLQALGYAARAESPNRVLVADVDRDRAGLLNSQLVQAGVVLYQSVLRKPTLEQWFLQMTASGGGVAC